MKEATAIEILKVVGPFSEANPEYVNDFFNAMCEFQSIVEKYGIPLQEYEAFRRLGAATVDLLDMMEAVKLIELEVSNG
jgi:hypothetical protein